ncbi:MAG: DUF5018 domain-containing protein [Prevotellaceae bacterium]|jgi:hypothetical protein|nr:DUF5018 domain-containing protein [Prevotellaceae bacterium]
MKTLKNNMVKYLLILGLILPLASCKDDNEVVDPPKRTDKEITAFSIPASDLTGDINAETYAIVLTVTPDFDQSQLENVVPRIAYNGVSIEPLATAPQDFTENVTYKVTAEDGTFQNYTVSLVVSEFYAKGFAKAEEVWAQTDWATLGFATNSEPTLACLGDKLVASRSGILLNEADGNLTGGKLNVEGADGKFNGSQSAQPNYPFSVTNDDAGNVIGTSLGAWTKPNFPIYKWTTSLESPPVLVHEVVSNEAVHGQFGRKISVTGNINGDGYIAQYSHNQGANSPGNVKQYVWKVTGGVVDPDSSEIVTRSEGDGGYYQTLIPMTTTGIYPYYVALSGNTAATLRSGMFYAANASSELSFIDGFLDPEQVVVVSSNWGSFVRHAKKFDFNGVTYIAVITEGSQQSDGNITYYLAILDTRNDRVVKTDEIVTVATAAGNGATSVTNSVEKTLETGEKTIRLYTLITNYGVWCHELSNKP